MPQNKITKSITFKCTNISYILIRLHLKVLLYCNNRRTVFTRPPRASVKNYILLKRMHGLLA